MICYSKSHFEWLKFFLTFFCHYLSKNDNYQDKVFSNNASPLSFNFHLGIFNYIKVKQFQHVLNIQTSFQIDETLTNSQLSFQNAIEKVLGVFTPSLSHTSHLMHKVPSTSFHLSHAQSLLSLCQNMITSKIRTLCD